MVFETRIVSSQFKVSFEESRDWLEEKGTNNTLSRTAVQTLTRDLESGIVPPWRPGVL